MLEDVMKHPAVLILVGPLFLKAAQPELWTLLLSNGPNCMALYGIFFVYCSGPTQYKVPRISPKCHHSEFSENLFLKSKSTDFRKMMMRGLKVSLESCCRLLGHIMSWSVWDLLAFQSVGGAESEKAQSPHLPLQHMFYYYYYYYYCYYYCYYYYL